MKSILEDLFMGRIDVMESLPVRKRQSVPDENTFIESLSVEQQEIYLKIVDSILDQCIEQMQDCFNIGFKMGVRIFLEALTDTSNVEKMFEWLSKTI